MKIKFLGATGTVTGSRFRLEDESTNVLVDCGMFQGPKEVRQKNWGKLEGLSGLAGVLLTHAHIDHSGLLPLLPRHGFQGPIYCSRATQALCEILLHDAAQLQEEDARFLNDRKLSDHDPALPLFTDEDVKEVLKLFQAVPDNQWVSIQNQIQFRLQRSGHILGSRFIEISQGSRILFSGDLGPPDSLLLKDPVTIAETDYLVLESTYGNRGHERADRKKQIGEVVRKVIQREGTLIIPAFSVGRAQEILFLLKKLEDAKEIPQVPVYLDSPMSLDATEIYMKYDDELRPEVTAQGLESPLRSTRFKAIRSADESMLICMDSSPKIVISAAGMLNGGRVLHHLRAKLPDPRTGVLFVGYQVPGTKGDLLRNGIGKIRIHRQLVDVEAEIFSISSLSAHADSDQIVEWCKGFVSPPKKTFLVHGEDAAREALAYRLKLELGWDVVIPKENQEIKLPFNG